MGTISEKIAYLNGTKSAIKDAIEAHDLEVPDGTTFRGYAALIGQIEDGIDTSDATATAEDIKAGETAYVNGVKITGTMNPADEVNLADITITPTAEGFTQLPPEGTDGISSVVVEGDENLTPENIADGITIFGVTGTMEVVSAIDQIPEEYQSYVQSALALFPGDYDGTLVLVQNNYITIGLLTDDFTIVSYNANTTEFTATGWNVCAYNKSTKSWNASDYTDTTSPGNNFIKNIRYSNSYIYYGSTQIYPLYGVWNGIDTSDATATAADILSGKTAYVNSVKLTGTLIPAIPIEISTDAGMTAVLTAENVGKCYKFTGTTGTYTNGSLYVVEEGS